MTIAGYSVVAARSESRVVVAGVLPTWACAASHRDWLQAKADRERHLYGDVTYEVVAVTDSDGARPDQPLALPTLNLHRAEGGGTE